MARVLRPRRGTPAPRDPTSANRPAIVPQSVFRTRRIVPFVWIFVPEAASQVRGDSFSLLSAALLQRRRALPSNAYDLSLQMRTVDVRRVRFLECLQSGAVSARSDVRESHHQVRACASVRAVQLAVQNQRFTQLRSRALIRPQLQKNDSHYLSQTRLGANVVAALREPKSLTRSFQGLATTIVEE